MLLYLARISAKKEEELLDLFHSSNIKEVEFFAVVFPCIFSMHFFHAFLLQCEDIYCTAYMFLCSLCYLSYKLLWNERVV